jgi:hypothetical protein
MLVLCVYVLSREGVTIDEVLLKIGFMGHFNTRLVTTLTYGAIADFITLQITTTHAVLTVCYIFTSRALVTASKSAESSASALSSLSAPTKSSF